MRKLGVMITLLAVSCLACGPLKRFAYEGFARDSWQQPERVIEALGLEPGDRVADLGAGSGYFTLHLAQAVGPTGKVYGLDVTDEMLDARRQELESQRLALLHPDATLKNLMDNGSFEEPDSQGYYKAWPKRK